MRKNLLFSIIIPVYNMEKYISQCVESVLKQGFPDYEIILVDDGSKDGSPRLCDELARRHDRVKVIHKENGGVSAARFDGLKVAEGEYVICVDGDDWLAENCLQRVAEAVEKSEASVICYGIFTGDGKQYHAVKPQYRTGYYSGDDMEKEIYPSLLQTENAKYFPPSLVSKAIKRKLLERYMLVDPQATIGEDGASCIPCIFHARSLYMLDECLYYYRYNPGSATKSKKAFNWEWPAIIARHISENIDMDRGDFKAQMARKITHDVFNTAASQFNRNEPYKSIVEDIKANLKRTVYRNAIRESSFGGSFKANMMKYSLQYSVLFPIYLYTKLKR